MDIIGYLSDVLNATCHVMLILLLFVLGVFLLFTLESIISAKINEIKNRRELKKLKKDFITSVNKQIDNYINNLIGDDNEE